MLYTLSNLVAAFMVGLVSGALGLMWVCLSLGLVIRNPARFLSSMPDRLRSITMDPDLSSEQAALALEALAEYYRKVGKVEVK